MTQIEPTIPLPVKERKSLPILLVGASAIIVIAALKLSGDLLVPVLLGMFLAVISFPVMKWLEARRLPHTVALALTVAMILAVLTGVVSIGNGLFNAFVGEIDAYALSLEELVQEGAQELDKTLGMKFAGEVVDKGGIRKAIVSWAQGLDLDLLGNMGNVVGNIAGPLVGRIASWLSTTLFVLIVMVFTLNEGSSMRRKIRAVSEAGGPDFGRFEGAAKDIQRYLRIKTLASVATGILAALLCAGFGLEYAVLWGVLAFGLNFIPVVGSIFAGVPPVLLAMIQSGYLSGALVMVGFLMINLIIGNFLEPLFLGRRFGLSTLVIILSVFFWGWMWGPMGMLLSVPLTMMLKVVFDNSEDFRWLSVAMGKGKKRLSRKEKREQKSKGEEAPA